LCPYDEDDVKLNFSLVVRLKASIDVSWYMHDIQKRTTKVCNQKIQAGPGLIATALLPERRQVMEYEVCHKHHHSILKGALFFWRDNANAYSSHTTNSSNQKVIKRW
jgi:hypothetical protein